MAQENTANINVLKIIYFSLLGGMFLFLAFGFFAIAPKYHFELDFNDLFVMIAMALIAGTTFASFFVKNRMEQDIPKLKSVQDKFAHYQTLTIMRSALAEGTILFCIVSFFFLNSNLLILLLALIPLGVFLTLMPSLDTFAQNYRVKESEKRLVS